MLAAAAATVVLGLGGAGAVAAGLHRSAGPPQPPDQTQPASGPAASPVADAAPTLAAEQADTSTGPGAEPSAGSGATDLSAPTMSRARPVALAIPSLGIDSHTVVELGKQGDGSLQVPQDFGQPGWYADGPAPGQFGPAVLAGHVDSTTGPGVFYRLGALAPGAEVRVTRADGSTARFVVDGVHRYPKNQFPTALVYGDTTHRSELRLITCGGSFDFRTGHYTDDVVAYAHLL